jgi:hypothetical protein
MVVLRGPPLADRLDGGHDAAAIVLIRPPDRFARLALLLCVLREDRGPILGADVIALAVELGRIVCREKDVEQVAIAQLLIVEGDADRFRVPGIAAADLLVGGLAADPPV